MIKEIEKAFMEGASMRLRAMAGITGIESMNARAHAIHAMAQSITIGELSECILNASMLICAVSMFI